MLMGSQEFDRLPAKNYGLRQWDYRNMTYKKPRFASHPNDCSVMTYRGHAVLRTLIRCHFSPIATTGQNYIYSGSADGRIHVRGPAFLAHNHTEPWLMLLSSYAFMFPSLRSGHWTAASCRCWTGQMSCRCASLVASRHRIHQRQCRRRLSELACVRLKQLKRGKGALRPDAPPSGATLACRPTSALCATSAGTVQSQR